MTSRKRTNLLLGLTLALIGLAVPAMAVGQTPEIKIENVRVGFCDVQGRTTQSGYKVGFWSPVWVDLKAGPSRFEGILEITAPDDNSVPTTIRRSVNVAANEMATVQIFVRPGSRTSDLTARVMDKNSSRPKDVWSGGSVEAFGPEMALVLFSGQAPGLLELGTLTKYVGTSSRLIVAPIRPKDGFPSRWYGFESAETVVLDTNDQGTMTRLNESAALIEWVKQGGHLVIAVGQNWQAVLDSPLRQLLPGIPSGRIELNDPGLFDQFASASAKPMVPASSPTKLRVTKFEDWEKHGGVPLTASAITPLVLRGAFGFGRVTMIGLDVDQKPFSAWDDKKLLWDKLVDLRGLSVNMTNAGRGGNAIFVNQGSDVSGLLHSSLERFPGVRLVPFGWVAFFVFLYILLIGPGDYFFLRKVVKKMEMTWITFPLIVIVVSGSAYMAAYYFKGTELRINKVDAVDIDQTTGLVRGWSWLTLFSPQNRDYDIGFVPLSPETNAPADAVVSMNTRPNANVQVISSWFGPPDLNYGGGTRSFGGGYDYEPGSEPEQLNGVRVDIWSTKSFSGRWSAMSSTPLLESDLTPEGPDRLRGTVTNVGQRTMRGASLFFGRYVYVLSDLAPGATVSLGEAQALSSYMDGLNRGPGSSNQVYYVNGRPQNQTTLTDESGNAVERPDLIRALMFHGGFGARAAELSSFSLRTMDLSGQLDLRRPMLVAEVNGPVAQLRLGGNGSPPKMTQTTVLRVILPLKAATPDKP